jgi:hypothetical protein
MSKTMFGGWSMFAILPAAVLVVGTLARAAGQKHASSSDSELVGLIWNKNSLQV